MNLGKARLFSECRNWSIQTCSSNMPNLTLTILDSLSVNIGIIHLIEVEHIMEKRWLSSQHFVYGQILQSDRGSGWLNQHPHSNYFFREETRKLLILVIETHILQCSRAHMLAAQDSSVPQPIISYFIELIVLFPF
jgi:hypothetical protein